MKGTNKILIGIVAGVVLLVVVAFVVTLRQPPPSYQDEATPDGIAHNYLLALRQSDYERAYGYLSPTLPGYPRDLDQFILDIEKRRWRFRQDEDVSLAIISTSVNDQTATVKVQETWHYDYNLLEGLFGGNQSVRNFNVTLRHSDGAWRIINAGYYYWDSCWEREDRCA
ncbi:MAG: hypothetical protein GY803_21455 [Chloroflexi bacterium]|nr:hypothetical protein [Chloroflexota bacterium]